MFDNDNLLEKYRISSLNNIVDTKLKQRVLFRRHFQTVAGLLGAPIGKHVCDWLMYNEIYPEIDNWRILQSIHDIYFGIIMQKRSPVDIIHELRVLDNQTLLRGYTVDNFYVTKDLEKLEVAVVNLVAMYGSEMSAGFNAWLKIALCNLYLSRMRFPLIEGVKVAKYGVTVQILSAEIMESLEIWDKAVDVAAMERAYKEMKIALNKPVEY
jgi:hypothetical protein